MPLNDVLNYLDQHRDEAVDRLAQFLAIPSVSTDAAHVPDIQRAAQWVHDQLNDAGLDTRIMPTGDGRDTLKKNQHPNGDAGEKVVGNAGKNAGGNVGENVGGHGGGHPAVVACTKPDAAPADAPTVLFYGHYDVQPPDPIEPWTTPPFEPTVREGHIYARGACDDKGQVACFLEALRAWAKTNNGQFPCHIKILIEGEEEIGSENLPAFIAQHRDLLAADLCIICDTSMWDAPTPPLPPTLSPASTNTPTKSTDSNTDTTAPGPTVAITYALRGLVYFDIQLHGPDRDLHSGVYGGTLANPANVLTRVLGKLFDDHNRITIPGFYDDVAPVTADERKQWDILHFNEQAFLGDVGAQPFGEHEHDTLTRRWARPACDINGLYGGYMAPGAKTVIPAFAGAKVSFRIPANMDPKKVANQFEAWLRDQAIGDLRWHITRHGEASPVATPIDSPHMHAASQAIQKITGKPPALVREGATIPVVADFQHTLKLDTLLIGFGLNSDNIHSPNEHFGLDRFHLGARTLAAVLDHL